MTILISNIPKAVNEFVFLFGIFGFLLLVKRKKKNNCVRLLIFATIIMIFLRLVFHIRSSRYASGLILFFSIYSSIALSLFFNKGWLAKIALYSVAALWILSWGIKNYNICSNNANLKNLAEKHEQSNRKNDRCLLYIHKEEEYRMKQMENRDYMLETYSSAQSFSDLYSYVSSYKKADITTLFDMVVDSKTAVNKRIDHHNACKLVLSFFSQKNKKKRHNVYRIQSDAEVKVLSSSQIIEPDSGILINGDFERIDSPSDSFKKLKDNISYYSIFFDPSDLRITPYNAYFFNDETHTQYLPFYSCSDIDPLSGIYSATIKIRRGYGYLFFTQKFQNGLYQYSVLLKATKGTRVCMLYKTNRNGKWNRLIPLVHFAVPDGRIYSITKTFEVNDLIKQDYFVIAFWVNGGEAVLDNFSIKRI